MMKRTTGNVSDHGSGSVAYNAVIPEPVSIQSPFVVDTVVPDFVAIAYSSKQAATDGRLSMLRLAPDHMEDVGDAVVAGVDELGTIDVDQIVNLWSAGSKGHMLWALVIGLLFLHPLLAVLPGRAPELVTAAMLEFGLGEQSMAKLRQMLVPGHAIVFLLASPAAVKWLVGINPGEMVIQTIVEAKFDGLKEAFAYGQRAASGQQRTVYSGGYT